MSRLAETQTALSERWDNLAPRERTLVLGAGLLVALAFVWWVLLSPALRTVRTAPAQHAALDARLEHMQSLAAQARQLQADASTRPSQADSQRAVQAATTSLGSARVNMAGERANVALQAVPANALAPWLAQVRGNARSSAVEAHLTRSAAAPANTKGAAANKAPSEARWDGSIVLALPPR